MTLISRILTAFATITFSIMCTVVFVEVIFRHFLSLPLVWSEELARIMLIWTVFLGAGAVLIRGEHIALEFLLENLPEKFSDWLRIINSLIALIFLVCLLVGAFRMIQITWVIRAESIPIIRMAYQYIVLFTGAAVMFVFTLGAVIKMLKAVLSKKASEE